MTLEEFNNNTFEQNIQYFLDNSDNIVTANYLHIFASEELEKGHDDIVINILCGLNENFKYYYIDWESGEYLPIPLCQNADLQTYGKQLITTTKKERNIKRMIDFITNDLDIVDQVDIYNNYCKIMNYTNLLYFNSNFEHVIDKRFSHLTPSEIIKKARFFSIDDYVFTITAVDEIYSFDVQESAKEDDDLLEYMHIDEIAKYIVENNDFLGCNRLDYCGMEM